LTLAVRVVALATMVVGIGGIVSPDGFTTLRRLYYATPGRFYTAGAVRLAMGLVLLLAASTCSRWPRILQALGAVMCVQALTATVLRLERARAIMEWEATQGTALLRVGPVVALAAGGFLAFAVITRRSEEHPPLA
jgi:hypothetical protein